MDPTSRAILLCGGAAGPEYIGTYKFTTPQSYTSYLWQVPAQTAYIQAVAWGSGGKGKQSSSAFSCAYFGNCGSDGGGGGFSTAVIPVTAGETLYLGVGTHGAYYFGQTIFNGGRGRGGGFTSVFRGSTPLIIAGGGGGGISSYARDAAGGGGGDPRIQNVLQYGVSSNGYGGYLIGGQNDGGGGYQGGNCNSSSTLGGTGYVTATGNLHTQTISADYYAQPQTTHLDYVSGYGGGARNNPINGWYDLGWGSGLLVIHCLGGGYNPASNPSTVIPSTRTILGTI